MKWVAVFAFTLSCWCTELHEAAAQTRPLQKMQQKRKENRSDRLVEEGLALQQQGQPTAAGKKFEEALELNPKNARAHANLALLCWQDNRLAPARNHAETALKIQPENPRAHLVMANLLMKSGKDLAASDHLRKTARLGNSADQAEATRLLTGLRAKHADFFNKPAARPADGKSATSSSSTNATPPATGEKPVLAVFAFSDAQLDSTEQQLGDALSEMLATSLINRNTYHVIERSQLDRLMQEQALGQTGALEAETVVVVGELLGAQAVVVGSLSRPATAFEADARILNVSTGEALAASHAKAGSSAQLRDMAETLALELSAKAGMIQPVAKKDSSAVAKP